MSRHAKVSALAPGFQAALQGPLDQGAAEKPFRHKVLALLRRRGLLSQERIELLNSWRRSGFTVHNRVFVHPRGGREFEALVRYMMRPPVSLARLHFTRLARGRLRAQGGTRRHRTDRGREDRRDGVAAAACFAPPQPLPAASADGSVARVLVHIPDRRRHLVRHYGAYSNASRGKGKEAAASAEPSSPDQAPEDAATKSTPSSVLAAEARCA